MPLEITGLSKAGEITSHPSPITFVLYDIEERDKLAGASIRAVHTVADGNKSDALLPKEDFRIEASLQVVPANAGHILCQHNADLPGFDVRQHPFPCGPLKGATRNAIVRIMNAVCKAFLGGVIFEVAFLIYDTVAVPNGLIVAAETLV